VQALGVFIDTILICTATAVMILLSGALVPDSGVTGTQLTQAAMQVHIGSAGVAFIAVAIFFFAFTSIIGNYSYSENAMTFLGVGTGMPITILRAAVLAMVLWGSLQTVGTVFDAADASMGLMATINLIAIVLLSGTVAKLTSDYFAQKKAGKLPVFDAADYPELKGKIDADIWSAKP
jgi:AGCS family alanine or glycine:cation symporter